jgi:hypothetical protein
MQVYLPTGKILDYDETSKNISSGEFVSNIPTSRHYKIKNDGKAVLYDEKANVSLVYENDEKYKFRLVYNGDAKNFICIEPQTGMANSPNSPFDREYAGFAFIKGNMSETYKSKTLPAGTYLMICIVGPNNESNKGLASASITVGSTKVVEVQHKDDYEGNLSESQGKGYSSYRHKYQTYKIASSSTVTAAVSVTYGTACACCFRISN